MSYIFDIFYWLRPCLHEREQSIATKRLGWSITMSWWSTKEKTPCVLFMVSKYWQLNGALSPFSTLSASLFNIKARRNSTYVVKKMVILLGMRRLKSNSRLQHKIESNAPVYLRQKLIHVFFNNVSFLKDNGTGSFKEWKNKHESESIGNAEGNSAQCDQQV